MRKLTIARKKQFLGKWMDYYLVIGIPQDELAEYTGVKKHALGFPEGLLKGSGQIFAIANDKNITMKVSTESFLLYGCYFDSTGIRFGEELRIEAGESDLALEMRTKMGLSANKITLSRV